MLKKIISGFFFRRLIMKIEKIQNGDSVTLALQGWLDTQAAPELEKELEGLGDDVKSLEFDCKALEYVSSSGIRQFVAAYKKMSGNFKLTGVSAEIMDVLNMTGISKRITIE